ncbi:sigma-54-dependent Fis family transcriptional regulator [Bacteroidia bacterium]|nr:sigma-54-dependent Fis family transcriptional regulator [Bacteroidia bacterium]GHV70479.1 sigma-54-dependent Fis family transcriptional regulator [Bacteroidia bacterium]
MNNNNGKILIIDDNEDVLFALNALLSSYVDKIKVSVHPEKIEYYMETFRPDLVLLDMNFHKDVVSGKEGFLWLKKIMETDPEAIVILMTAYADTEKAVQAIKAGATDFISKPWEKEKLLATIFSALKLKESRRQIENLKMQVQSLSNSDYPEIIGESEVMLEIFSMIEKLSETEANILILGENGTGKDLIARAVFHHSLRSQKVFTTIDLGAIPETLFESELFGHEKGAFTDAKSEKAGRMEIASGGTLFLDEIGNLSLAMQAKLLAAIEKKQISRLGSTRILPIDVRFISATNMDIYESVVNGAFRQDLLYRINTIEIHIPPLRERGRDIILLATHFIEKFAHKYKKNISGLSPEAKEKIMNYAWPGNVRELQNVMERSVILSSDKILKAGSISLQTNEKKKENENLNLTEIEREAIEKALKRSGGNLNKAADLLGITRYALYRKTKKE